MTCAEAITAADALRPNQYPAEQKLRWLGELDAKLLNELRPLDPTLPEAVPETLTLSDTLLAPFPYAGELYTTWLFTRIDYHNGEIARYNQSAALFQQAFRDCVSHWNRTRVPTPGARWRL